MGMSLHLNCFLFSLGQGWPRPQASLSWVQKAIVNSFPVKRKPETLEKNLSGKQRVGLNP